MQKNLLIIGALLALLPSMALAQTYPQVAIENLPPPPIGTSGNLIQGDTIPIDRVIDGDHGTYGVTFNPVGSCSAGQFVTSINIAGQPTCSTPNFNAIAGTISLAQLGVGFSDGQLLIGNSSTGQLVPATLTPGTGVSITNANGSITISSSATTGATLGTSALATNPQRTGQAGTGLYSSAGGNVDVASLNTQIAEFSLSGLNLVTGAYTGSGSGLTSLNASNLSIGTVAPARLGSAFTNGQIFIGNTSTGQLSAATLTAGTNVTITNGPGTITINASGGSGGITALTGDVTASGTGSVAATVAALNGVALGTTTATSGNILVGQGSTWVTKSISGDISITNAGVTTVANTAVTPGSYTNTNITVNSQGRITAISNGSSGGTGIVNPATQYQLGYYATTSSTISGSAAILTDVSGNFLLPATNVGIGTSLARDSLDVYGSVRHKRRTVTSGTSDTVLASDYAIYLNKSTPSASAEVLFGCTSSLDGKTYKIGDETSASGLGFPVIITPTSGTIQNLASYSINWSNGIVEIQCDASSTNWVVKP